MFQATPGAEFSIDIM
jgi:alpha-N-arabinofuranosidase